MSLLNCNLKDKKTLTKVPLSLTFASLATITMDEAGKLINGKQITFVKIKSPNRRPTAAKHPVNFVSNVLFFFYHKNRKNKFDKALLRQSNRLRTIKFESGREENKLLKMHIAPILPDGRFFRGQNLEILRKILAHLNLIEYNSIANDFVFEIASNNGTHVNHGLHSWSVRIDLENDQELM